MAALRRAVVMNWQQVAPALRIARARHQPKAGVRKNSLPTMRRSPSALALHWARTTPATEHSRPAPVRGSPGGSALHQLVRRCAALKAEVGDAVQLGIVGRASVAGRPGVVPSAINAVQKPAMLPGGRAAFGARRGHGDRSRNTHTCPRAVVGHKVVAHHQARGRGRHRRHWGGDSRGDSWVSAASPPRWPPAGGPATGAARPLVAGRLPCTARRCGGRRSQVGHRLRSGKAWGAAPWQSLPHPLAAHGWRAASAACVRLVACHQGHALHLLGPRRADRRSTNWCQLSLRAWLLALRPPRRPGSRLALAWAWARFAGHAGQSGWRVRPAARLRCSASRRRRLASACVGWAVRTGQRLPGGTERPSTLRRSWCQASSSASTPCWRALQPGQRLQQGAGRPQQCIGRCGQRGQLGRQRKGFGSSSQACVRGVTEAQSSASRQAPPAAVLPHRAAMRAAGQASHPCAPGWPHGAAPSGCEVARHGGWAQPARCSRSSAKAWKFTPRLVKGAGGPRGVYFRPTGCRYGFWRNAGLIVGAVGLQLGQQRGATAPQPLQLWTPPAAAPHPRAPPGG